MRLSGLKKRRRETEERNVIFPGQDLNTGLAL
jgi:hypothetical protein